VGPGEIFFSAQNGFSDHLENLVQFIQDLDSLRGFYPGLCGMMAGLLKDEFLFIPNSFSIHLHGLVLA